MRVDRYLKVSRLIKRRTIANAYCDAGKVLVNGKPARASLNIKIGDKIEINFAGKKLLIKVLAIAETVRKEEAEKMYEIQNTEN